MNEKLQKRNNSEPNTYEEDVKKAELLAYATDEYETAANGLRNKTRNLESDLDSIGECIDEEGVAHSRLVYLENEIKNQKQLAENAAKIVETQYESDKTKSKAK